MMIDNKINILKKELDDLNDPNNEHIINFKNLQDKLLLNSQYNASINMLSKEINEVENMIHNYRTDQNNIMKKIKLYNDLKIHMDHNKDVTDKINMLKDEIKQINNEIKELTNKNINNKNIQNGLTQKISNIEKTNKELEGVTFELTIYEILSKLTSRDGVQLFLLKESLQNITNKVNNILEPFINKTINMALSGDTIELSIISKTGDIIHTISGMESFMLDLVFKIIIGQISVIPKANLIFLDESISVLDSDRMSSIEELFAFLRQYYNTVFLITHMKQVNNHINHSLDIVRHNGHSLIFNIKIKNDIIESNNGSQSETSVTIFGSENEVKETNPKPKSKRKLASRAYHNVSEV
jgi:DNA repair exonuclease SbcCD ATPase subunit